MTKVNVTFLRQHLPDFLDRVSAGEEILVVSKGKVVARLLPPEDPRGAAERRIAELRGRCRVGDVVSPVGDRWEAADAGP